MGAEYRLICQIKEVVDDDSGNYEIGEISGSFDREQLKRYIQSHGTTHLFKQLAYLQYQVFETMREVNMEKSSYGAKFAIPPLPDTNVGDTP